MWRGAWKADARGMTYDTPVNLVQLLDDAVGAAARTPFYRSIMSGRPRITCLDDFRQLPVTPIGMFRRQRLADVVADPARVQWIAGPHGGHDRRRVAVAEGIDETGSRYELFKDALRDVIPNRRPMTCAVVTAPRKMYFAAEVSTILGYLGIPAHIFVDNAPARTYERVRQVNPGLLVILSGEVDESELPSGVELCITFRCSQTLTLFRQLDMYLVDEFGFLGHSTDLRRWVVYNDQYLFERSESNRLVVTALRNHTQPLLRLETRDTVKSLSKHEVELEHLSESG